MTFDSKAGENVGVALSVERIIEGGTRLRKVLKLWINMIKKFREKQFITPQFFILLTIIKNN